jgi:hypothetical protein
MVMQLAYIWVALVLAVSSASAGEEQKTHPVRPTDLLLTTGRADRIVVFDWSTPPKTLYTTTSKRDIAALANALIVEPPKGWLRCACIPEIEVELSRGGKALGSISLQRDLTIGFTQWSGDARLAAPEKLLRWFDARGINGPRRGFEEILTDRKTDQVASERWFGAMPPALRPLWRKLLLDPWKNDPSQDGRPIANALKPELLQLFPDDRQRIRVLFGWFGSGAGPWSGFPWYEDVPAQLLLDYQPSVLIAALQGTALTDSEMEGAARLFSRYAQRAWFPTKEDKSMIALLPVELRKTLLEHVLQSGDQDNIERARRSLE